MTISAKVIADSISPAGKRITTFELEYPRFIHAEFMTHRAFSRNAASSRAIPVARQIELIRQNTAMPIHWGKNQPGMSAKEECNELLDNVGEVFSEFGFSQCTREHAWNTARDNAIQIAEAFNKAGYHKQIVNRLLEPFAHIKVVCTATEFDNFFWLRRHPDAQPEIQELANCMWEARQASTPVEISISGWHLPYFKAGYLQFENHDHWEHELEDAIAISASCCAQVSYRKHDDSLEKARAIYKRLVESKPVHASPFEHQATPIPATNEYIPGVTHLTKHDKELWSGNFCGWIQHRQLIPYHVCNDYKE